MKGEQGWNPKRYYHYQSMLKNRLNNYVKEDTLGELVKVHPEMLDIYGEAEQLFYNQITRVLIGEFIRDDFVLYLLTSKRLDRTKIYHHLAALRNIRGKIKKILLGTTAANPWYLITLYLCPLLLISTSFPLGTYHDFKAKTPEVHI